MSARHITERDRKTGAERRTWIVDFVFEHAGGRVERVRKVSPVPTRRGAEEYERQLRAALLEPVVPRKEVPTFGAFVDERWWPTYPAAAGNRHTTVREKESHLRCHLKPALERYKLDEIKRETLDRLIAKLIREKGLSPKRAKNIFATLRRILVSAWEWEVIPNLPRFPKVKCTESRHDFFVREESDKVLAVARNPEERAILMFAFHTGARAGEQLAFEWTDLDLHNKFLVFRRSSTNGIVGPTKSGKERKVPLTRSLESALRSIRHMKGPRVFCNPDGKPLTLWQLHERLWGACRRAGLRRIRWHDCRHSFASQLVIAGTPLRQVQEWLGHSTIMMTMRYSHLAPGGGREFLSALDGENLRQSNGSSQGSVAQAAVMIQ
jgi:integrase